MAKMLFHGEVTLLHIAPANSSVRFCACGSYKRRVTCAGSSDGTHRFLLEFFTMPFIRTAVPEDTAPAQCKAIVRGIHDALVASIGMPEDELFNLVSPYKADHFFFDRRFNGVARSDRVIVVEITMRRGRSDAMKRALYAQIAHNLESQAGVAPADVFIFTHENDYSDWSVGHGQFAMNLVQQRGTDI
jgi:phenylpyruvate tautomerase PptA (4-oxalocrotonate tautomerase family)